MSFSRVNAPGWAVNDKLTSSQMNALDIDHANAVDKTTAGDTVSGTLAIAATGKVSTSSGGILELANNDYPALKAGHSGITQVRAKLCTSLAAYAAAWTVALSATVRPYMKGAATADLLIVSLNDVLQNGATLTRIDLLFAIAASHANLPTSQPLLALEKYKIDNSNTSVATVQLAAANTTAYYNAGAQQTLSLTGLTEVIDKANYSYSATIIDENGINSIANNLYFQLKTTATIADVRPF